MVVTYDQTVTGDKPLCYIPIHEIHAVERVDEEAFGMKFVCYKLSTRWLLFLVCIHVLDDAGGTGGW